MVQKHGFCRLTSWSAGTNCWPRFGDRRCLHCSCRCWRQVGRDGPGIQEPRCADTCTAGLEWMHSHAAWMNWIQVQVLKYMKSTYVTSVLKYKCRAYWSTCHHWYFLIIGCTAQRQLALCICNQLSQLKFANQHSIVVALGLEWHQASHPISNII